MQGEVCIRDAARVGCCVLKKMYVALASVQGSFGRWTSHLVALSERNPSAHEFVGYVVVRFNSWVCCRLQQGSYLDSAV